MLEFLAALDDGLTDGVLPSNRDRHEQARREPEDAPCLPQSHLLTLRLLSG